MQSKPRSFFLDYINRFTGKREIRIVNTENYDRQTEIAWALNMGDEVAIRPLSMGITTLQDRQLIRFPEPDDAPIEITIRRSEVVDKEKIFLFWPSTLPLPNIVVESSEDDDDA